MDAECWFDVLACGSLLGLGVGKVALRVSAWA